jgi:capsular exopolysaccharide synthesis family protein
MPTMIPRTIVASPDDLAPPPVLGGARDIIPLPGSRRPASDGPPIHGAQSQTRSSGGEVGPRDIVNALKYHSVLFVTLGGLVAAGLGAAAFVLVPAKYTTYATLVVEQRIPTVLPVSAVGNEDGNFSTFLKTQASFIKNRKTTGGALLDPKNGIAQLPMLRNEEDQAAYLEDKITIDLTDTSNSALRVALSGDDPRQITLIVNAVVDYYLQEVATWRKFKADRIASLEKSRNDLQQRLNEKLKHYQDVFPPVDGGDGKTLQQKMRVSDYIEALHQRATARMALGNARGILKASQAKLGQLETNPPAMPIDDIGPLVERSQDVQFKQMTVNRLWRDREAIRRQAADLSATKFYELDHHYQTEKAELDALRPKVRAQIEKDYQAGIRVQLATAVQNAQADVGRLEELDKAAEDRLTDYKDLKEQEQNENKKMADEVPEKDSIQRYRVSIEDISRAIDRLATDLDAPARVQLWHKAEEPTKKDIRKQAAATGAAGLAGFGLVGGLISLYELKRKRVYGPGDPLFRQRVPLIGCLPECSSPASAMTDAVDPAGRAFFEAVDKMKAVLCRQLQRRKMQAVLVTSAAPGEGKSAVAWHLALSLARSDRRTLFIDGNLRNPGVHNHFDIASHPGLSEVVRGERQVHEVVQRTALDNLWCIAAGVCDTAARHGLDKESLRQVLDWVRRDFDYIVIDTCSIREAVDPLYLAQRADATVLAVRSFQSGAVDVERACERLMQLGTPLLGAVLNDPSGAGCEL